MSVELKIKSKHLALEPAIIRKEERKLKRQRKWLRDHQQDTSEADRLFWSLHTHRKWDVRNEARATFLARAYINGYKYKDVEAKVHDKWLLTSKIYPRIVAMVSKYGSEKTLTEANENVKKWLTSE